MSNDLLPNFDPDEYPAEAPVVPFGPDELVKCEECGRMNPPVRERCLYCGGGIAAAVPAVQADQGRVPESWEQGLNVIALGSDTADGSTGPIALSPGVRKGIPGGVFPLPVARLSAEDDARSVMEELAIAGVKCTLVADKALRLDAAPVRLRGMEFTDAGFVLRLFNSDDTVTLERSEVMAAVSGTIRESRARSEMTRKRGKAEMADESHSTSDTPVIDLYTAVGNPGYRIVGHGFDFSCLGTGKSMIVRENMGRLAGRIREAGVPFCDEYDSIRGSLDEVWPVEVKSESSGMQATGLGRRNLIRTDTVTNLDQFNRYSRMRCWLYETTSAK